MESHLSEESLWASALAARLRVLQASFADDPAAARREYISQEIENALKGTVPEKRRVLLEALAERFPAWEQEPSGNHHPATSDAPAPETAADLLEKLLQVLPGVPEEARVSLAERLKISGLISSAPAGPVELSPELLKRLGLGPERSVSPERAGKALGLLLDMVLTLDQLAWTLWKQVAPKSTVRREGDLPRLSGEYLAGSAEVSTAQLQQSLERTRKLVAGLLGAVGRAGTTHARERARIFDPTAIEADARAEKKWNESVEYACWRKYVQLNKEYGAEAAIEKNIQEALAKATENLITGRPNG